LPGDCRKIDPVREEICSELDIKVRR
jgi:hypothetical protein